MQNYLNNLNNAVYNFSGGQGFAIAASGPSVGVGQNQGRKNGKKAQLGGMNLLLANNATVSNSTNANTDYSTTVLTTSSPLNLNQSVAVTQLSMLTKGGSNSSNSNIAANS
jgi:hypothetical protein